MSISWSASLAAKVCYPIYNHQRPLHTNIFCVFLKIQIWLGNRYDPLQRDWHQTANGLQLVKTGLQLAIQKMFLLIFCGCKKSCGAACWCRRAGLLCSSVCTTCLSAFCLNASVITVGKNKSITILLTIQMTRYNSPNVFFAF